MGNCGYLLSGNPTYAAHDNPRFWNSKSKTKMLDAKSERSYPTVWNTSSHQPGWEGNAMTKTAKSIAELEQILAQQKKSLRELQAKVRERRDHLISEIAAVNAEIDSLSRELGPPTKPRVVRRKRAKRLPQYILEVLKTSREPMSAAEIADAVTKAGYRSSSKNFVGLVRRTCYLNERIYTKERGKFAIKSGR